MFYVSNICSILIDLLQIAKNLETLPLYEILQICGAFPHVILKDVVLTCGFKGVVLTCGFKRCGFYVWF